MYKLLAAVVVVLAFSCPASAGDCAGGSCSIFGGRVARTVVVVPSVAVGTTARVIRRAAPVRRVGRVFTFRRARGFFRGGCRSCR